MIENAPNIDIFMKYLLELHYIFFAMQFSVKTKLMLEI